MLHIIVKLVFMFVFAVSVSVYSADCGPFGCIFQPGTVCLDGKCVTASLPAPIPITMPAITPVQTPSPTPTPNPKITQIKLKSAHLKDIVPENLLCDKYDSANLDVFLSRTIPPPFASFFSVIIYTGKDLQNAPTTTMFVAQKDITNRYVFIRADPGNKFKSQFYGADFVFNQWKNLAYTEVLKAIPCGELASTGAVFLYGISFKEDLSDFEGASFTFDSAAAKH